ncbi:unnamed protein product [Absidia cylindrospora]
MGMIRRDILVDFISGPAIAGHKSGSAIAIGLGHGQRCLQGLEWTRFNRRILFPPTPVPRLKKLLFFMEIMKNGLIVIVGTLLSFMLNMGRDQSPIKIIKEVSYGCASCATRYY